MRLQSDCMLSDFLHLTLDRRNCEPISRRLLLRKFPVDRNSRISLDHNKPPISGGGYNDLGSENVGPQTPDAVTQLLREDLAKWGRVIRTANIKLEG
jgi:hypothetical protein